MAIKNIIQESLNKNPLGVKEALQVELMSRIALALEAKKDEHSSECSCDTCMSESLEELDETKRTDSYRFTVPIVNGKVHPDHLSKIEDLKKEINDHNSENDDKKRLVLNGRMGKDNPNSQKYKDDPRKWGKYQRISLADAKHADVYVGNRYVDDKKDNDEIEYTDDWKPTPKKVDTTVYGKKHYAKVEK